MVEFNNSYSTSRHLRTNDRTSSSILPTLPSISSTGSVTSTYRSSYRAQPRSSLSSQSSSSSKDLSGNNDCGLYNTTSLYRSSSFSNGSATVGSRHYGSYSSSGHGRQASSSTLSRTSGLPTGNSRINHSEIEKIANKYRRSVSIDSLGSSGRSSEVVNVETASNGRIAQDVSSKLILAGNGLVGLKNLGNTCFMNSILQCLSHSALVREYFLSKKYKMDLSNTSKMQGRLAEEFASLLNDMWSGRHDTVSPNKFKSAVAKSAPRFVGYSQQDSQEFLRFFMEGLHEDLNTGKKGKRKIEEPPKGYTDLQLAEHRWNGYTSYDNSTIVDIFVGLLKSTLTCSVCDHKSVTFDPFWDLSLPLPRSKSSGLNLLSCFAEFTQEEILDGDEKPTCENCKKRQKCTKQFSIERFPPILVLHLKRFSEVRYRTKLSTKVDFPIENLDLSDLSSHSHSCTPKYDLVGVSNHSGNTFSGHYIAYCKVGSRWHRFSDSSVSSISRSDIVSSEAYVLFYERQRPS
ncbi:ubiquitin carboxyl-terminal hydrolase 2-like isoform X3 [Bolinopsis microptera]|uniref:ubiquitin carboxyl-terminal hydrolase 2-like isoform X3 n=1 Tax=Bolinopsis microptera TaxID=2820187 RepID=UPI00307A6129